MEGCRSQLTPAKEIFLLQVSNSDSKDITTEPERNVEKKLARKKGEKLRRDKINKHISCLSDENPWTASTDQHLDKLQILRLTVNYLKLHHGLKKKKNHTILPSFVKGDTLQTYLQEVSGGFLIIVSQTGNVVFVSKSITKILGHSLVDLIGHPVYNIIHKEDHELFDTQFEVCKVHHTHNGKSQRFSSLIPVSTFRNHHRSFVIRMRRQVEDKYRNHYEYVHVLGHVKHNQISTSLKESKCSVLNEVWMVAVGKLLKDKTINHLSMAELDKLEFCTQHGMDGCIWYSDQRVAQCLGELPSEAIGMSCYNYLNPDDVQAVSVSHMKIMTDGEVPSTYFRLNPPHGGTVYIQSRSVVVTDMWTKKPKFISSINIVLGEEEGKKNLEEQRRKVEALIAITKGLSLQTDDLVPTSSDQCQNAPTTCLDENQSASEGCLNRSLQSCDSCDNRVKPSQRFVRDTPLLKSLLLKCDSPEQHSTIKRVEDNPSQSNENISNTLSATVGQPVDRLMKKCGQNFTNLNKFGKSNNDQNTSSSTIGQSSCLKSVSSSSNSLFMSDNTDNLEEELMDHDFIRDMPQVTFKENRLVFMDQDNQTSTHSQSHYSSQGSYCSLVKNLVNPARSSSSSSVSSTFTSSADSSLFDVRRDFSGSDSLSMVTHTVGYSTTQVSAEKWISEDHSGSSAASFRTSSMSDGVNSTSPSNMATSGGRSFYRPTSSVHIPGGPLLESLSPNSKGTTVSNGYYDINSAFNYTFRTSECSTGTNLSVTERCPLVVTSKNDSFVNNHLYDNVCVGDSMFTQVGSSSCLDKQKFDRNYEISDHYTMHSSSVSGMTNKNAFGKTSSLNGGEGSDIPARWNITSYSLNGGEGSDIPARMNITSCSLNGGEGSDIPARMNITSCSLNGGEDSDTPTQTNRRETVSSAATLDPNREAVKTLSGGCPHHILESLSYQLNGKHRQLDQLLHRQQQELCQLGSDFENLQEATSLPDHLTQKLMVLQNNVNDQKNTLSELQKEHQRKLQESL